MGKHVKKWDRCFDKLKDEKGESGAAAICSSSIDNAGLKAENQKRDKKDYYSNKKKSKKKLNEKKFSTEKREKLAKNKKALPDGSFPIENVSDLKNAIKTYGLAKDKNKAKNWIKKRAKELNAEKELPKTWVNENEIQKFRNFINEEIEIRKIEDYNDEEHYNFSVIYDNYVDNIYTTIDNLKKEYDGSDVIIILTKDNNNHGPVIYRDGKWFNILNEDANATYPGPNLTNPISGQLVGSGSDGKLGTKQTEIEGGDDSVTSGGEYPLKYKSTVKGVSTRDTRQRKSAIKKLQKLQKMSANNVKMKSFSEFNNEKE